MHPLLPAHPKDPVEAARDVEKWFPALHSLVIGPGLGRDEAVLETARHILRMAVKASNIRAVVIDGDGLWAIRTDMDLVR